jgi:PAS domain S-box-containing protein
MSRWVRNTVHPSVDVSGRVTRLDGILADVTERKLIELSLRASEQKLRVALESFPDTIITQDRELRYTSDLNPKVAPKQGDMRGRTVWSVLPPHEAENIARIRQQVLQTGKTIREVVPMTRQGMTIYNDMVTSPLRGGNGEIEGVISYRRDITDQVMREQQLQNELAALRKAYEALVQSQGGQQNQE